MPNAREVKPEKWSDIKILLDNEWYSAIWGYYDGDTNKSLGVRWNGDDGEVGFPNAFGKPVWYVEPEFLTEALLLNFLSENLQTPGVTPQHEYVLNILEAIRDLRGRRSMRSQS